MKKKNTAFLTIPIWNEGIIKIYKKLNCTNLSVRGTVRLVSGRRQRRKPLLSLDNRLARNQTYI